MKEVLQFQKNATLLFDENLFLASYFIFQFHQIWKNLYTKFWQNTTQLIVFHIVILLSYQNGNSTLIS